MSLRIAPFLVVGEADLLRRESHAADVPGVRTLVL